MITPAPRISTMLPISLPRGANIISNARVARLMNFMVMNGVSGSFRGQARVRQWYWVHGCKTENMTIPLPKPKRLRSAPLHVLFEGTTTHLPRIHSNACIGLARLPTSYSKPEAREPTEHRSLHD